MFWGDLSASVIHREGVRMERVKEGLGSWLTAALIWDEKQGLEFSILLHNSQNTLVSSFQMEKLGFYSESGLVLFSWQDFEMGLVLFQCKTENTWKIFSTFCCGYIESSHKMELSLSGQLQFAAIQKLYQTITRTIPVLWTSCFIF